MEKRNDLPWYQKGLRFECTQCGECCSGEPGYVFVDDDEVGCLSAVLHLEDSEFRRLYTRKVGRKVSLKEYPDGDCILLDPESRKCLAYHGRPVQCRTWPFWDSTLSTPEDWKDTCDVCPGSGQGRLYSLDEIEIRRSEKTV